MILNNINVSWRSQQRAGMVILTHLAGSSSYKSL
jgi:hypothetical protein